MTPIPIKRSKTLVPLSKDHHEGLLMVWKIRQGLRFEIAKKRIADFIIYAFDAHLEPHFIEEEELLFTQLPGDDELLIKAKNQHTTLRQMTLKLSSNATPATGQFNAFARLLEEHIRFEERELFGPLEAEVSDKIMADIGTQLETIYQNQQPLQWKDEFWVRK